MTRDRRTPEGGWGWMVVIGSFLNQLLFEGLVRSYGYMYLALQERFDGSAMVTSWIQACFSGIALLLAPVACMLAERFGCRLVVMTGGVMISASLAISSVMPQLSLLYLSYSILGGVGGSLIYSPMFLAVSEYFDVKRGRALGLASFGSAIGTFAIPTLVAYLIETFGYQGCMLIQAGIMLNHCVSGVLYRPLYSGTSVPGLEVEVASNDHAATDANDSTGCKARAYTIGEDTQKNIVKSKGRLFELRSPEIHQSDGLLYDKSKKHGDYNINKRQVRYGSKGHLAHSILNSFESALSLTFNISLKGSAIFNADHGSQLSDTGKQDTIKVVVIGDKLKTVQTQDIVAPSGKLSLWAKYKAKFRIFKDVSYLIFLFQIFTVSSTIAPNFYFLPPLAKEVGLNDLEISVLLLVIGTSGFFGTLIIGIIFDFAPVRRHKRVFYSLITFFHAGSTLGIGLADEFVTMVIACACMGFTITSVIGQRANAASHYVTAELLPFAFGMMTMFQGIGNLFGPAMQGLLQDRAQTYKSSFYYGAAVLMLSSVAVVLDYGVRQMLDLRKKQMNRTLEPD